MHSVLHEKEQLVRERLLLGILHASVDVTALPQEYMKYGLVFPYRFFSLILIHMPALESMEDFAKKEQLRLVVLSSASEAFSVLGKAYGIHTNGQNICILLNTSIADAELTAELKRLCSAISQRMQQTLSIDPFFSIVLCEQASPSYQKSWQLARRNLLFTSPETEDFMIIGHQEDLTSSLDPNLSIQLSRALIDRDQTVARKIADSFFSRYLETANTQEARKLTTILLCEVYVALLDFGDDIPDTQLSPYLKKLENAADPSECSRIFFSCIQGLLNAKTKTSMEAHTYICQAISYIQQHYREELSVPQIADVVSLNPVYLSRLFKLDTGKTLSEYLNCYRTECSLALLTDTADTIQSISQKVGYSDVRSYIRFFKKYYDVIHFGDYYRLTNAMEEGPYAAWEFVSEDGNEALVSIVASRVRANDPGVRIRLRGLKENQMYLVNGVEYPGGALMHGGILLEEAKKEYQSWNYHITAK